MKRPVAGVSRALVARVGSAATRCAGASLELWLLALWLLALWVLAIVGCTGRRSEPMAPGESASAPSVGVGAAAPAPGSAVAPAAGAGLAAPPPGHQAQPLARLRIAALAERAGQGSDGALASLRRIAAAAAPGADADHAALALGGALVTRGGGAHLREALPHLRRAAAGEVLPAYGRLLFAQAVIGGEIDASLGEARELLAPVAAAADTPALDAESRRLLLHLATRAGDWRAAASWGEELLAHPHGGAPPPDWLDEASWLTAEAQRLAGEHGRAVELYQTLWLERPGGPWGARAQARLAELAVEAAPATPSTRLARAEQLQQVGLHREALAALAPLLARGAEAEARARALLLAARSHFVLRENERVVAVAERLRQGSPRSPQAAQAALEAMRALGRGDQVEAVRAWERWLRTHHRGSAAAHEARFYLGSLLGPAVSEAAGVAVLREVAASDGPRAPDARWRMAWLERRRGRDAAAREQLEALLASHPRTGFRSAALYWLARLADPPGGDGARELYHQVRREAPRDYYGRRAAERLAELGEPLPPLPAAGDPLAVDSLRDPDRRPEPAYRRAVALRTLGLPALAARELETVDASDDPPLGLARLHLLARAGHTWDAIGELLASQAERLAPEPLDSASVPREVWETYYPFPYREAIEAAAHRAAEAGAPLDAYLLAALARRESRLSAHAVSAAGAVGLLQLMPETAARAALRLGRPAPGRSGLFDPAGNLELGAAHLAELLTGFAGEWAPAVASYNAGEGVVREWWSRRPAGQPVDEWIETIPWVETRLYVKAVLGDTVSYRELYGGEAGLQPSDLPGEPFGSPAPSSGSTTSR